MRRFSDLVEVAGLDEAYLDLSESPAPKARARQLKREMRAETGLVCSVGLAPNKLLAKIASDLEKPDGLCVLEPDGMLDAVGERPADPDPRRRAAHGRAAGPARRSDRGGAGGDRRRRRWSGPSAPAWAASFAIARAATTTAPWSRSASGSRRAARRPSPSDVSDRAMLAGTLDRLADSVCRGLAEGGYAGRTVTLKIRLRPFRTHTRSRTIEEPTRDPERVRAVARQLLDDFELDAPVRLLGVGVVEPRTSRQRAGRAGGPEPTPRPSPRRHEQPPARGRPVVDRLAERLAREKIGS